MLYNIAHTLQSKVPIIWEMIEGLNSFLFSLRYRSKLKAVSSIWDAYSDEFKLREATANDVMALVHFFNEQPMEAFDYFKPHQFDEYTIRKLIKRKSFLFCVVETEGTIVGYFFIRCFFIGKCFRGKIVDYRWRNKGIAKVIGQATMDYAQALGLHLFGTISKSNPTSMASAAAVNDIRIIKELPDDNLYIEYFPKGSLKDKDL